MAISVCVLGGFNSIPELHELNILTSNVKDHKFIFPDLDHIKDINEYYIRIKNCINESDHVILLKDSKKDNKFLILFGMVYQSDKNLKITSINDFKKFIENKEYFRSTENGSITE